MHLTTEEIFVIIGIGKCLIGALPEPLPTDPRLYGFLYRFLHALVLNFRAASGTPQLPTTSDVKK